MNKTMEQNEMKEDESSNFAGALANILLSGLFIALGFLMLLIPNMKLIYFCYGIGGIFLISGICFIVRYFIKEEYRKLTNFGFSAGTLLVILGGCALVRGEQVASYADFFLGILILIEGIIMLQNALQLKYLKGKIWGVNLIFSVITIIASLLVLLDVKQIIGRFAGFMYYLLIYAGIAGLLSFLYVAFRIYRYEVELKKETELEYARNMEENVESDVAVEQEASAATESENKMDEDATISVP